MLQLGEPSVLENRSLSHSLQQAIHEAMYPHKPEKYILLSQKGAITEWHVLCSGSAVFYHVVLRIEEVTFLEPWTQNKRCFSNCLEDHKYVFQCKHPYQESVIVFGISAAQTFWLGSEIDKTLS